MLFTRWKFQLLKDQLLTHISHFTFTFGKVRIFPFSHAQLSRRHVLSCLCKRFEVDILLTYRVKHSYSTSLFDTHIPSYVRVRLSGPQIVIFPFSRAQYSWRHVSACLCKRFEANISLIRSETNILLTYRLSICISISRLRSVIWPPNTYSPVFFCSVFLKACISVPLQQFWSWHVVNSLSWTHFFKYHCLTCSSHCMCVLGHFALKYLSSCLSLLSTVGVMYQLASAKVLKLTSCKLVELNTFL